MTPIRHVLLVEDDVNDARLTTRYLERWRQSIGVEVLSTLGEANAFLQDRAQEYPTSLILLDHMLPGGSSIELVKTIREHPVLRTVPVVVLTGNSDGQIVQRAREAGANSCVLKPIDPEDYERTVHAIAEFWIGTNLVVRPEDRATVA
jgi:CheY-like chemotaxis protein